MQILLAVDGSQQAEAAIEFLSRFPFAEKPDILLVHVCPMPDFYYLGIGIPLEVDRAIEMSRQEGERILKDAASKCFAWANSVKTNLLSSTAPAQALVQAALESGAQLIVTGARGLGAVNRFFLGSISDAVSKHAPCSVLIVRPRINKATPRKLTILLADDGGEESTLALQRFAKLPLESGSKFVLMTVADPLHAFHAEYVMPKAPELRLFFQHVQECLNVKANILKSGTADVQTLIKEGSDPAFRILEEAEASKPDLIVVGCTGKSAWHRAFLGSVSTRVLHHAQCSVWIERKLQDQCSGKSQVAERKHCAAAK